MIFLFFCSDPRTCPDPGKVGQVLPGSDLVEENVVLGTDAGHLADLRHLVGVTDVVAEDGG